MKKIISVALFVLVLFMLGCVHTEEKQVEVVDQIVHDSSSISNDYYYFEDGRWDATRGFEFQLESGYVNDVETARQIADALMDGFQRRGHFTSFVLFSIEYDGEADIWMVTYSKSRDYPGTGLTIAIDGASASVLRVFIT